MIFYAICINVVTKLIKKISTKKMRYSDDRNRHVTNTISGIKSIKFNTLENIVIDILDRLRKIECNEAFKELFINLVNVFISMIGPLICTFVCVSLFILVKKEQLEISEIFFILNIFMSGEYPIRYMNYSLISYYQL